MADYPQELQSSSTGKSKREGGGGHGDTQSNHRFHGEPKAPAASANDPEEDSSTNIAAEGTEVFCGRIPKDVIEDELRNLFQSCGPVLEFRLPKFPDSNLNRGFAFIQYIKKEDAIKAIAKLNGKQIRRRQYLRVTRSLPNRRLFVGNIPKAKGKEELVKEFSNRTIGLKDVIIYSSPDDDRKNRGFCFLEYDTHKTASLAKRKLSFRDIKVWGCDILVDWADPLQEVDDETMSKVRILYAKNVCSAVSEEELRRIFSAYGKLDRVKKIKDFAFIHFAKREEAAEALNGLQGIKLRGAPLNISWAKPPTEKETRQQILRAREKRILTLQALKPTRVAVNPFPEPNPYLYTSSNSSFDMGRGDMPNHVPPAPIQFAPPHQIVQRNSSEESLYFRNSMDDIMFIEPPFPRISSQVFNLVPSETEEEALPGFPIFRPKNKPRPNRQQRNSNVRRRTAAEEENWRSSASPAQRPRQWANRNFINPVWQPEMGRENEGDQTQENWRQRP